MYLACTHASQPCDATLPRVLRALQCTLATCCATCMPSRFCSIHNSNSVGAAIHHHLYKNGIESMQGMLMHNQLIIKNCLSTLVITLCKVAANEHGASAN